MRLALTEVRAELRAKKRAKTFFGLGCEAE